MLADNMWPGGQKTDKTKSTLMSCDLLHLLPIIHIHTCLWVPWNLKDLEGLCNTLSYSLTPDTCCRHDLDEGHAGRPSTCQVWRGDPGGAQATAGDTLVEWIEVLSLSWGPVGTDFSGYYCLSFSLLSNLYPVQMRSHWMKSQKESLRLEEAGLTGDVLDSAISSFILEVTHCCQLN